MPTNTGQGDLNLALKVMIQNVRNAEKAMDIEGLRLTDEELEYLYTHPYRMHEELTHQETRTLLDAQLAKALWGLVDDHEKSCSDYFCCCMTGIDKLLEAAGIPRPETE